MGLVPAQLIAAEAPGQRLFLWYNLYLAACTAAPRTSLGTPVLAHGAHSQSSAGTGSWTWAHTSAGAAPRSGLAQHCRPWGRSFSEVKLTFQPRGQPCCDSSGWTGTSNPPQPARGVEVGPCGPPDIWSREKQAGLGLASISSAPCWRDREQVLTGAQPKAGHSRDQSKNDLHVGSCPVPRSASQGSHLGITRHWELDRTALV